jgi:hypothetical protein
MQVDYGKRKTKEELRLDGTLIDMRSDTRVFPCLEVKIGRGDCVI